MRVAFFALLLVNLLYMGWSEWIDVPPAPAPSAIEKLPRLTLVSDLPPEKRAALATGKMALLTPPVQCVSVGPFDDPATSGKAATVLLAKGFTPQQRVVESSAVRRLWVYLDQFRSDATEERVLHRLEGAGIDDAEAMPAAAGGRRVSLGLFTDNLKAQSRIRAVRAMGFHPLTAERVLPGAVYWLDLTLPNSSTPVPLKDVSDLEPDGASSAIGVRPCASVQSAAAPVPPTGSPSSAPAGAGAPVAAPKSASTTSSSSGVPNLPECRPGGGGPVPCVAAEPKKATDPSVF